MEQLSALLVLLSSASSYIIISLLVSSVVLMFIVDISSFHMAEHILLLFSPLFMISDNTVAPYPYVLKLYSLLTFNSQSCKFI
jgi:hypothetical protein